MPFDYLIVGLGNPGVQYCRTRHNAGFMLVDCVAQENRISICQSKYHSLVGQGSVGGRHCLLAQPQTFMNRSGLAIKRMLTYTSTPVDRLLVAHDDLDLPLGRIRLRAGGGAGGHHGVNSIITSLQDRDFLRLKIGIGRPPLGLEPEDYVLENFFSEEWKQFQKILESTAQSVESLVREGPERAMNLINSL